jgi:hypothetical protein
MTVIDVLAVLPPESKVCIKDESGTILYESGVEDMRLDALVESRVAGVDPVFLLTVST